MRWTVKNTFVHVDEEEDMGCSTRLTRSRSDSSLLQVGSSKIITELDSRDPVSVEKQWTVKNTFVNMDEEEDMGCSTWLTRSRSDSSLPQVGSKIIMDRSAQLPFAETTTAMLEHADKEEVPESEADAGGSSRSTESRSDSSLPPLPVEDTTTTAKLDIGKHMILQELIALLDEKGLNGEYDFVYIPGGFKRQSKSVGYAVVNFVAPQVLQTARSVLESHSNNPIGFCAYHTQGLQALITRYQHSDMVVSRRVEDMFKPALFQGGKQTTFHALVANGTEGRQADRLPRKRRNRKVRGNVQRL